jgi:hypothetical protein
MAANVPDRDGAKTMPVPGVAVAAAPGTDIVTDFVDRVRAAVTKPRPAAPVTAWRRADSLPGYASRRCGPTPSGMPVCRCGMYTSFCVRPSSTVDSTSSRSNSGPSWNRDA